MRNNSKWTVAFNILAVLIQPTINEKTFQSVCHKEHFLVYSKECTFLILFNLRWEFVLSLFALYLK